MDGLICLCYIWCCRVLIVLLGLLVSSIWFLFMIVIVGYRLVMFFMMWVDRIIVMFLLMVVSRLRKWLCFFGFRLVVGLLMIIRCGLLSSVWVILKCWCMLLE